MKYIIAIFVTAVLVFLGATVYYKGIPTFPEYNPKPFATQDEPLETVTPTPTPPQTTLVKAGGVLVFNAYSLELPSGWQYAKEVAPTGDIELDKLTLTKGTTKITIFQAATGGAQCLFPGDPDVEGPSSRYTTFVNITTQTGQTLRRGGTAEATGFTGCEKQGSNPWGQPTSFGHISISTPGGATPEILKEVDSILTSLRKI